MGQKLIRTDKNGTKYYHNSCPCLKCGGNGYIKAFSYVEGGICFECNGSGINEWESKEYTPEYEQKLIERRQKANEKRLEKRKAESAERNKEFFKQHGFNENGKTYVALGNTYAIKDDLKAKGFKYKEYMGGWYSPVEVEGVDTLEISVDDIFFKDCSDTYEWNSMVKNFYIDGQLTECPDVYVEGLTWHFKAEDLVKKANTEYVEQNSKPNESEYVANVGDKIEIELTVDREVECNYGVGYRTVTSYLYIMHDNKGNVVTWKASNCMVVGDKYVQSGDTVTLKGTVKEHSVYNGVKQTVLTRCKVS